MMNVAILSLVLLGCVLHHCDCLPRTYNDGVASPLHRQENIPVPVAGPVVKQACGTPSAYTQEQQNQLVQLHNDERQKYGVTNDLSWDDDIAARAQEWADMCIFGHGMNSDCSGNYAGQNGYFGYSANPTGVVGLWNAESANWDFASKSCKPGKVCGHWTQVVWSNTQKVGCGVADCTGKSPYPKFIFCNYSPPGNYVGQAPFRAGNSAGPVSTRLTAEKQLLELLRRKFGEH